MPASPPVCPPLRPMPPGRPVGKAPSVFAPSPAGAPESEPQAQIPAASIAVRKRARAVIGVWLSIVLRRRASSVDSHNPCCAQAHICAKLRYVGLNFEELARDFIRALRGSRSQA